MKLFVTGGAGFIGSAVIRRIISNTGDEVVNIDKLTYAGNLESLAGVSDDPRYHSENEGICDAVQINALFDKHRPESIIHLAA